MARLTAQEWANARSKWESDPRDGYEWLAKELNVSRPAVHKQANKEGDVWVKKVGSPASLPASAGAPTAPAKKKESVGPKKEKESTAKAKPKVTSKAKLPASSKVTQVTLVTKVTPQEKVTQRNFEDVSYSDHPHSPAHESPQDDQHQEREEEKRGRGRPTSYRKEYADMAKNLCMLFNATDEKLADFFDVALSTITKWKIDWPEFSVSIREGKEFADAQVARSLFERATGYSHPDVHISNFQGEVIVTDIIKHYPPDTAAARYWLNNRRPNDWREKKELQIDASVQVFPSREVLDAMYQQKLTEAAEREMHLLGDGVDGDERMARLGLTMDTAESD